VVPFVPIQEMTMDECVELSKLFAKRVNDELAVPIFLYENSASTAERRNLATIRKGQFEGMKEKIKDEKWFPDFGEREVHPTAGVTAIAARMPLIAFNINLDTANVQIAKNIAKVVRESSGGFKDCKAIGLLLEERNIAQVSLDIINFKTIPL